MNTSAISDSPQIFRDSEKGRTAYILGGGASLALEDPAEAEGCVVIATNHQVWATKRLGFPAPKYWAFVDARLVGDVCIDSYPDPVKVVAAGAGGQLAKAGYLRSEDGTGKTYFQFKCSRSRPLNRDAKFLQIENTTTNVALHLAWILGCTTIHLRGIDLGPDDNGRWHWWEPNVPGKGSKRNYQKMLGRLLPNLRTIRDSGVALTVGRNAALSKEFPATGE